MMGELWRGWVDKGQPEKGESGRFRLPFRWLVLAKHCCDKCRRISDMDGASVACRYFVKPI